MGEGILYKLCGYEGKIFPPLPSETYQGDIWVRISDPWEKSAPRKICETLFWLETSKNDHSKGGGAYGTKRIWNTEAKSSQIYKFKYAQVTKQLNHLNHIKWHRRCKSDFLVDKCK